MTEAKNIFRVGGVPEHFNYPWHMAIEMGLFKKRGVEVQWVEQKLGTGAMIKAVKSGEVDMVLALTEGLVGDILQGSDLRLVGTYVKSPLTWAVSTGSKSKFNSIEDLKSQKFGISRFKSGSHLMVCVLALERGWHPSRDISFEVKGDFKSLRDGLNDDSTAAFLWETFTTKPYHDSGEIRRIGQITTPWPCFQMACRKETVENRSEVLEKVIEAIQEACVLFHSNKDMPEIIAKRYGLKSEDAKAWYDAVHIAAERTIAEAGLERAMIALIQAGVIPKAEYNVADVVAPSLCSLRKDIKFIKLYNKPELLKSFYNNLRENKLIKGPIEYKSLLPYDQHHYFGVDALEEAKKLLSIDEKSSIINIGSGLGGPARYFAGEHKVQRVLAVELQDDLNRAASELTERCSLSGKVTHICGDFLKVGEYLGADSFDHIVSWLTVLHIKDRETLFKTSNKVLKKGGLFFAEDFYALKPLNAREKHILEEEVFCPYVPSMEEYKKQITDQGFEIVECTDLTESWLEYSKKRVAYWDGNKEELTRVHRADTFKRLRFFYNTIKELYEGGSLGGLRIIARKL